MYICICKAVTDKQLKVAIKQGACTRKQLFDCLGVGADCGKCNPQVRELLNQNTAISPIMPAAGNDFIFNASHAKVMI